MSFDTEAQSGQYRLNLVFKIGDHWYSQYQIDSDLTDILGNGLGAIEDARLGVIDKATVNPVNVDIKKVNTTINTVTITIFDRDSQFTLDMGNSTSQLLDVTCDLYVGFITGSFDLADYYRFAQTKVKTIKRNVNGYTVTSTEVTDYLNADIYNQYSTLTNDISSGATSLTLEDASEFDPSGLVKIEDEFIQYTSLLANTLNGLSRGDLASTAALHKADEIVYKVYDTGDINPITLLLQMMISPGGGGTYDVLDEGLGIDESLIDVAGIETLRDDIFTTDEFRFYLYDIGNALKFFEQEILLATNTRFVIIDGQISLALLDQVDLSVNVPVINEESITGNPNWSITSDKIVNKVTAKWNWSEGLKKFSRISTFIDQDSIDKYGEKQAETLEFKGVLATLNGSAIVANRANRLLARLATPRAEISAVTNFSKVKLGIGSNVFFSHNYLPQAGAGLGLSAQLEILSKAIDFKTGQVSFKLNFTSYSGIRIGLIAPSRLITGVTSQSVFTLSSADGFESGYALRLWDEDNNTYFADTPKTILSIAGNVVTMATPFTTTLAIGQRIKFADYNDCSDAQKGKYAFICGPTGVFDDGSKAYEIIF